MHDFLEPILPQVPVEGLAIHIARAGLSMGDPAEARLLPDGRVGIYAQVRRRFLGLWPQRRVGYLGHLGPVAAQIVAPALLGGLPLRLRIVQLTPEHLAGASEPMVEVSVWGDLRRIAALWPLDNAMIPPAGADPDVSPAAAPARPKPPSTHRNTPRTAPEGSGPM